MPDNVLLLICFISKPNLTHNHQDSPLHFELFTVRAWCGASFLTLGPQNPLPWTLHSLGMVRGILLRLDEVCDGAFLSGHHRAPEDGQGRTPGLVEKMPKVAGSLSARLYQGLVLRRRFRQNLEGRLRRLAVVGLVGDPPGSDERRGLPTSSLSLSLSLSFSFSFSLSLSPSLDHARCHP